MCVVQRLLMCNSLEAIALQCGERKVRAELRNLMTMAAGASGALRGEHPEYWKLLPCCVNQQLPLAPGRWGELLGLCKSLP